MKIAALIPCYNHGKTVGTVTAQLTQRGLDVLLVNDGSKASTGEVLRQLAQTDGVDLVELPTNRGKGGAVIAGLRHLVKQGYSHAVQVDADGQHDLGKLDELIAMARRYPNDVISGRPIYGDDVPKGRLYGRYATHVSVWLETLSLQIQDSMCGFRVYPLAATCELVNQVKLGERMDFDIEILVRLYWKGLNVHQVPTPVHYPEDGISHFQGLRDNVRISWLHTRLIANMLPRAPKLLLRNIKRSSTAHWAEEKERGSVIGIKLLLWSYRTFGRKAFSMLLHPVIAFYFLADRKARQASRQYLAQLQQHLSAQKMTSCVPSSSYPHFYSFGQNMLDKLAGWHGDIGYEQLHFMEQTQACIDKDADKGRVIIGSHLGNLELCRAMSEQYTDRVINALVFTKHAENFNSVMRQVNPNSSLNLIQVTELGPEIAILLQQKLERGEWVVIVGDRTSITQHNRVVWQDFLGKPAPFPQGPFVLSALLKHPVYLMFGFSNKGRYEVFVEPFEEHPCLPRKDRQKVLEGMVSRYASRLEHFATRYPLQWFNFFDFWKINNEK
ncbi:glycosyltransferase family 2 protein [Paraferrimonas sedimenticola]|uniref:Acyltransferase n=1 Tax=Paraferrimonas sedimenticola TaxID=375674 RepID=A0AA37RY38_9GAMM|nr:glycosyltransferase family 2 protein [Paraferrimonas sedimenticola]GLP97034.1 acyltransferase [Paraferrimonas sedimenticola]